MEYNNTEIIDFTKRRNELRGRLNKSLAKLELTDREEFEFNFNTKAIDRKARKKANTDIETRLNHDYSGVNDIDAHEALGSIPILVAIEDELHPNKFDSKSPEEVHDYVPEQIEEPILLHYVTNIKEAPDSLRGVSLESVEEQSDELSEFESGSDIPNEVTTNFLDDTNFDFSMNNIFPFEEVAQLSTTTIEAKEADDSAIKSDISLEDELEEQQTWTINSGETLDKLAKTIYYDYNNPEDAWYIIYNANEEILNQRLAEKIADGKFKQGDKFEKMEGLFDGLTLVLPPVKVEQNSLQMAA